MPRRATSVLHVCMEWNGPRQATITQTRRAKIRRTIDNQKQFSYYRIRRHWAKQIRRRHVSAWVDIPRLAFTHLLFHTIRCRPWLLLISSCRARLAGSTTFKGNEAYWGGAVYNSWRVPQPTTTLPADTVFIDNRAQVRSMSWCVSWTRPLPEVLALEHERSVPEVTVNLHCSEFYEGGNARRGC